MTEAEKERAAVVAWLRESVLDEMSRTWVPNEGAVAMLAAWQARVRLADRIENGKHLESGQ